MIGEQVEYDEPFAVDEADAIVDDVQRNHVDHMEECPDCTWWRCAKYPCSCGEYGPRGEADGPRQ